jgi:two-component system sensor histidine kinase AlgZ
MNSFLYNEFIFSPRYRVWRHIVYWCFHIAAWAVFWVVEGSGYSFGRQVFSMMVWTPLFILFGYPLVYGAIPHLLLKGKIWQFFLVVLVWGAVGLFMNAGWRFYIYGPLQEALGLKNIYAQHGILPAPQSYLCMTTSVGSAMAIKFFKQLTGKQRALMQAQQEKITAQLQLLKAQVHPHFLFNTLNNIYSFSLDNSPKTPALILKLSSLLSYMLYDCKTEEVRLEKEVEIMKNYIDLEKERYGNKIEISWNVEGEIKDIFISPLLMLPFLENAFKHGASEQIEKPWMGVDISVLNGVLKFKITNSKNEYALHNHNGIGINNVKKRLEFLYPGKHELKISDEGDFFAVSLAVKLVGNVPAYTLPHFSSAPAQAVKV